MATGFIWNERYMWHDNGSATGVQPSKGAFQPGMHLENAETKRKLKSLGHEMASNETLERFHTPEYISLVQELSDGRGGDAGESALIGSGSAEIAKLAVGGTCAAVAAVCNGEIDNAYALTRPPGHHAERDKGRGFCIFNNIGLAIMQAQADKLVQRVAVIDWDVHHGNGTQQAFYDSADVLTLSIHQEMLYPVNLGTIGEQGENAGHGIPAPIAEAGRWSCPVAAPATIHPGAPR